MDGAGSWHRDEIRNIKGVAGEIINISDASGPFYEHKHIGERVYPSGSHRDGTLGFDASRTVPTGEENVPQHVWQPVILYLGSPA